MSHRLLELLEGGSLTEIGRACEVSPQAVYDWRRRARLDPTGFHVPVGYIRALCALFRTAPAELRPDIFEPHWRYKK